VTSGYSKETTDGTYPEVGGAALYHQFIRLGFVLVIESVQIEARFLQYSKLNNSVPCITKLMISVS